MPKTESISLQTLATWEVETLRLTAFPTPAAPAEGYNWWTELIGEPPEITTNRPRESARREEGPFCGGRLINEVRPVRIDWLLAPSQETGTVAETPPSVGRLTESLEPFSQVMNRWLSSGTCPTLARLAFGAVLFFPVESRVAGYQQLAAYLPFVQLDPFNSSDFLYQINRPRTAESGLTLNRLSRWSVAVRRELGIAILGPSQPPHTVMAGEAHACRLQLDVNTDQRRSDPLPHDSLVQLLEELVRLAKEIVSKGDIP